MDKSEEHYILIGQLAPYEGRPHSELVPLAEAIHVESFNLSAPSGKKYQVQIQFLWEHEHGGTIRVVGGLTDTGVWPFVPLAYSFVVENAKRFEPSAYAV